MSDETVEYYLLELKERAKTRTGAITDEVIADALGVTITTIARWRKQGPSKQDEGHLAQLRWLWMQARCWYLRVMPAVVVHWRPGESLAAKEAAGLDRHHGNYFAKIDTFPVEQNVIEYRITLAEDLEYVTFMPTGPDRRRIELISGRRSEGTGWTTFPSRRAQSLKAGDLIHLRVRYLV